MRIFPILNGENRFYVYIHKTIEFRDSLVIAGKIKGRNDALVW